MHDYARGKDVSAVANAPRKSFSREVIAFTVVHTATCTHGYVCSVLARSQSVGFCVPEFLGAQGKVNRLSLYTIQHGNHAPPATALTTGTDIVGHTHTNPRGGAHRA